MDPKAVIDVALLGAVPQEVSPLFELLESLQVIPFRGQVLWLGKASNLSVLLGTTGLGKVNAAITAAALLEHFPVAQVWNVGCAGAYPQGPLKMGDVLVTDKWLCGDEGVLTQNGVLPVSEIGIPLLMDNGDELFDHLPRRRHRHLDTIIEQTPPGEYGQDEDTFTVIHGPSLTVGMASGDPAVAGERFHRYGAYAENMEGSAVAQACLRFGIPVMECRGMSNMAGVRGKETWRMEKSIAHCHGIVINWIETLKALKLSN
jgi:futalosine hydrolase